MEVEKKIKVSAYLEGPEATVEVNVDVSDIPLELPMFTSGMWVSIEDAEAVVKVFKRAIKEAQILNK